MNKHTIEQGILRFYYVAWAGFTCFYIFAIWWEWFPKTFDCDMSTGFCLPMAIKEGTSLGTCAVTVFGLLWAVALPWVVMRVGRWIYRGFVPK